MSDGLDFDFIAWMRQDMIRINREAQEWADRAAVDDLVGEATFDESSLRAPRELGEE